MDKEEQINEDLLSDLVLAFLLEDEFSTSVINTRLINRMNEGLVNMDDLVIVYKCFI